MEIEVGHGTTVYSKEWWGSSFKALGSLSLLSSRHKRSKSDTYNRVKEDNLENSCGYMDCPESIKIQTDMDNKSASNNNTHLSLKHEIMQLEERLQKQFAVRCALEMALGHGSMMVDAADDILMPQSMKELIREIAVLELEVAHLEQYLLSLYRKSFDQQIFSLSPVEDKEPTPTSESMMFNEGHGIHDPYIKGKLADYPASTMPPWRLAANRSNESCIAGLSGKFIGTGACRSQSALSQRPPCSARISSEAESKSLRPCHSQPISFLEDKQKTASEIISLAEYLGTSIADHVHETPNRISEELVRCIGSICCKLAEPSLAHLAGSSSPTSSCSSLSAASPQYLAGTWSPGCRKGSSLDARLENPYRLEGLKDISGPYNVMVEIPSISISSERLTDVGDMLKKFRLLSHQLERANIMNMKNEEKLAFWINMHNALVMQAYVESGIPQSYLKRSALLFKAKCNVGGHMINVETIRSSILRHHTHHSRQWLRTILSPKKKLKPVDEWQTYALERPEPLLHFALCSGFHYDPAVIPRWDTKREERRPMLISVAVSGKKLSRVRIYCPDRVFQQLEAAKGEYIRAVISIRKEQKILLPKILESYTRDLSFSPIDLVNMIQVYLPETLRMAIQRCIVGRSQKCVEWVPHSFHFRYLFTRELLPPIINL